MAGEADEVAAVFSKFDKDGSGDIDVKELGKAIRQLGITVGTAVLRNLMKGYDADGSGALSVDEFRELVKELREYQAAHPPAPKVQPPEDISSVFRRFDADGSGDIDPKELVPALSELNLSADTAEAKQILSGFDGDNSGGLDIDEFSQLVDALRAFMKGQMAEEQQPPADGTGGSSEGKKSFAQSARGGMKSARVFVAALTKRVPKRNYLPTFRAKKTDAQEKQGDFQAYLAKQEEEAKKRKAKADAKARKRKKKGGDKGKEEEDFDDGERQALCMTIITIVLTLVLTLAEAFDLDVLVGFMMMPFISAMKWLAAEFDNQSLDPTIWAAKFGKASSTFAQTHPLGFVVVDFAIFAILVVYFLYEADLKRWWATRNMRAQGYDTLDEEKGGGGGGGARSGFLAKVATDPDALQQLVRQTTEDIEEHDLMVRLRGTMEPEVKAEMDEKRAALEESIQTYKGFLSAMETEQAEAVDLEELAREAAKAEAKKKREGGCTETTKMVVTVIKNAIAGIITIVLYFMDLITDYQVTMLFYNAEAYGFAFISACLLVGQFLVLWLRVLPYLRDTYGSDSSFCARPSFRLPTSCRPSAAPRAEEHRWLTSVRFESRAASDLSFLWGGFPLGMFMFDFLMFLGPFGLLPIVPLPENVRQFVPAYAATRVIAEVVIEALPQCIMQAVVLVMVSQHVRAGTASTVELNLMKVNKGTFTSTLPKSILISSLTMLKTWYELVQEAREAGIGVGKKGLQLWNVGYGLPLDAIKSGSIYGWKCQYEISDNEIVSLVDALGKNDSLQRLDLSLAGFEWMPPVEREERSALTTLLAVMNGDEKALEDLDKLIICPETKWEIPVKALRSGPDKALKTLNEVPFLSKGGPERKEVHAMFELLCKNRNAEPSDGELKPSIAAVTKIFNDAKKENVKSAAKRVSWQNGVAQLMTKGMTRRAHFKLVVGAEVLRNVGFGAQELLDLSFTAEELKAGLFEAKELRAAGFSAKALMDLEYTPREMWEAEVPVSEMKALGCTAGELRDGGYTAEQMKDARSYTLAELRAGRYKPVELGGAGYLIPDLRAAGFTAFDLRKALVFQPGMMRDAGYTCSEMKAAGYDAEKLNNAGYSAQEATDAGYTVPQMFEGTFAALDLRKAGHTAAVLREAGYELRDLQGAGYLAWELEAAGYSAQELKEAGTSLVQLKAAGTPVAVLKDAGYTAQRLKQQGYTAAELAFGARGRIDVQTLVVGEDTGGYTAKELRAGGITAVELKKGKIFFRVEEFKDGPWPTSVLRDAGYSASELRACGYKAGELQKVGYSTEDLVVAGFSAKELREIGAPAGELREAGLTAKQLSDVGYTAKELLVGGFSAKELIACGFGVAELCEAGFDAIQLRALGFTAKELKAYGYGAAALKEAGSVVKELKELGFPDQELEAAGFTRRAVKAVDGRSVWLLKEDGGYKVAELREYGFVVGELRGIYTVKDLKGEGFSLQELREGGVPEHAVQAVDGRSTRELRRAGYPARVMRKVGFSLSELVKGAYTATELKEANYGAAELKEVSFTAGALRVASFTSKQLRTAGYTLKQMQEGGFFWKDLVIFLKATHAQLTEAGFRNLDPLHRLFLEYRPEPEDEESGGLFNDLSVFSPRYHPSTQPLGLQIALFCSSDKGLVLREGHQMESELCGRTIPPGTALVVVAVKKLEDGTRRGRVALKDRANLQALGWVTLIFKDGSSSVTFTESNAAAAAAALQVETVAYQREESDFVPVPRWRSFEIGSPLRDVMASIGDAIVRGTRDFR